MNCKNAITSLSLALSLTIPAATAVAQPADPKWSGAYIGIGFGGKFAQAQLSGIQFAGPNTTIQPNQNSLDVNAKAARIDILPGHDWQIGNRFLIGMKGEIGWGLNGRTSNNLTPTSFTVNGTTYTPTGSQLNNAVYTYTSRLNLDSTIGMRLGYVQGKTLLYVPVGLAIERMNTSLINPPAAGAITVGTNTVVLAPGYSTSKTNTKTGVAVGIGVERMLGARWRLRGEWRYVGFPSETQTRVSNVNGAYSATNGLSLRENVVNVGITYRFR